MRGRVAKWEAREEEGKGRGGGGSIRLLINKTIPAITYVI